MTPDADHGPSVSTPAAISTQLHLPEASSHEASGDGLTFVSHMIAGAAAGMMEHVAMYPIDTIKTRMQALGHPGQRLHGLSMRRALQMALKRDGILGLYRGVGAVALGAGPAHALHFAVYEAVKKAAGGNEPGHHVLATGGAATIATLVNDAVMTPADVIKQRLQLAHSPYKGVFDCVRRTVATEGVSALYRSYRTTVVMNIPYTAMHFSVYESAKKFIADDLGEDSLMVQLFAGGMAGGAAAAVTTPLDVVKTRLQTQGVGSATHYGDGSAVLPVLRRIVADEGWAALWRGVKPRVMFHMPAAAVCWGTYESMKSVLAKVAPVSTS